jgi:uncharacterized membrane protein YcjF (UPF0283 family)
MKYSKITILLALLLFSLPSIGQGNDVVEMADVLRQDGKIYTVVFGLVIILTAMIILLIRVDRKLFRLEQDLKREK